MCFVNNEDEDEDIIFLRIKALKLPLLHRGGQQKRIDNRFVVPLFEEAENARTDAAALRTPNTLVIAFRIVIAF